MIDINFYIKIHDLNLKLLRGEKIPREDVIKIFEQYRSPEPVVYNIETTNACNMKCQMCPRTTMMTRKISTIKKSVFERIIDQLRPWSMAEWNSWENFISDNYRISKDEMSENHFFLYIIPDVIQLHGYGDPLLDPHMHEYVNLLSKRGLKSYFSCNPANIDMDKTVMMFENGLDYIKYSIESVDDSKHKEIRGEASNFSESYKKILNLLELKEERNYKTTIIITMLDLNKSWQKDEYEKLLNAFKGLDVYIYLKSEDQQWYRKDYHGTNSIHWSELCKHPWMSMTIKSNSEVAMCMEDFNNEIILGNASNETLFDIWNGEKYSQFRNDHFFYKKGIKCSEQCDMKVIGACFND
jgi:MoaA/NifB/PqqE/SkfB family radical SAM enzyme